MSEQPDAALAATKMSVPVERATAEIGRARNVATIEVKTHFELDDAMIFNLNGEGIKITLVTEN